MKNILISYFKTPLGELILGSYQNKLCLADWRYRKMRNTIDNRIKKGLNANFEHGTNAVLKETTKQLTEYFNQERTSFELNLLFIGTDFQKKVWTELLNIPFGKTASYLELAKKMENVKAIRAVAAANGANALSIIVPCHRIIGSDGKLVGYAGGIPAKKKLLQLEGVEIENQLRLF